jgi:hypothetical protein
MTTKTFPILAQAAPVNLEWSLQSNTQTFTSPLNGTMQTLELPGARWRASFTFQNLAEADAAKLQAFLVSLRGQAGRFYLYNFARPKPNGVGTGTPRVNGAGQSGGTLLTDGWTASQTGILKAGDFIGVNGELKMVTADVNSDGSGNATLSIEPPLRSSPADNSAITVTQPTTTFMLTEATSKWVTRAPIITDITIDAIEMF